MGFIRLHLALVPRQTGKVAYKTLVRPQIVCAAPICHPPSQNSVSADGEGEENSCQVDLHAIRDLQGTSAIC